MGCCANVSVISGSGFPNCPDLSKTCGCRFFDGGTIDLKSDWNYASAAWQKPCNLCCGLPALTLGASLTLTGDHSDGGAALRGNIAPVPDRVRWADGVRLEKKKRNGMNGEVDPRPLSLLEMWPTAARLHGHPTARWLSHLILARSLQCRR